MSALAQQQYQQNQVNMATPAELTLMLYKGAIRFINGAKAAIDKGNVEEANTYNLRAQAIIRELLITLNMDIALSKDLAAMYEYMISRLIEANIKKDKTILDEVKGYCEEFAITWSEAMKLVKK